MAAADTDRRRSLDDRYRRLQRRWLLTEKCAAESYHGGSIFDCVQLMTSPEELCRDVIARTPKMLSRIVRFRRRIQRRFVVVVVDWWCAVDKDVDARLH